MLIILITILIPQIIYYLNNQINNNIIYKIFDEYIIIYNYNQYQYQCIL